MGTDIKGQSHWALHCCSFDQRDEVNEMMPIIFWTPAIWKLCQSRRYRQSSKGQIQPCLNINKKSWENYSMMIMQRDQPRFIIWYLWWRRVHLTSLVLILLFCQHFGLAHSPLWTKVLNFIQIRKTRLIRVVVNEGCGDIVDCPTQLTLIIMVLYIYLSSAFVYLCRKDQTWYLLNLLHKHIH